MRARPQLGTPRPPVRLANHGGAVPLTARWADTHTYGRREPRNQEMAAQFLATGTMDDLCLGQGCYSEIPRTL